MNHNHKKKFFRPARLIIWALIAMVSLFGLWLFMRAAIVKGMTVGIQKAEVQGYQIGHGGLDISGFPFKVIAHSNAVSVRAPTSTHNDSNKNWAITLDQITAESATLTPLSWAVNHRGTARVDMRSPLGARYMFDIAPAKINTDMSMGIGGTLKSAHIDMAPTRINSLLGSSLPVLSLGHARADLSTLETQAHVTVTANDIVVSDRGLGILKSVLGQNLERIELEAIIYDWPVLEKQGAEYWRKNGGRIDAQSWALQWGKIDVTGDFDIVFKDNIPTGLLHLRIKDIGPLLETLTQNGLIDPTLARQAQMLMNALQTDEDGRTKIELTLRNNQLKYGFLTLARF